MNFKRDKNIHKSMNIGKYSPFKHGDQFIMRKTSKEFYNLEKNSILTFVKEEQLLHVGYYVFTIEHPATSKNSMPILEVNRYIIKEWFKRRSNMWERTKTKYPPISPIKIISINNK